jgi:hypothetical protein
VPTPTLPQARRHHERLRTILAAAKRAVRAAWRHDPRPEPIARVIGSYQLAAAATAARGIAEMADDEPLVNASAFPGWTAAGFPMTDPVETVLDAMVEQMLQEVQAEAGALLWQMDRLVSSELADTWRQAEQAEFVVRPDWQNYVRMLTPPSCARCAILAGRIYRDLEAFQRHDGCDCVMIPVQNWQDAHDNGLVSSFETLFEQGNVRGLSKADEKAIRDGANPAQVVNAVRGTRTVDILGQGRFKTTPAGATRRSAWRKAHPNLPYRLRPDAIYKIAKDDRAEAIRLLRTYGYIR